MGNWGRLPPQTGLTRVDLKRRALAPYVFILKQYMVTIKYEQIYFPHKLEKLCSHSQISLTSFIYNQHLADIKLSSYFKHLRIWLDDYLLYASWNHHRQLSASGTSVKQTIFGVALGQQRPLVPERRHSYFAYPVSLTHFYDDGYQERRLDELRRIDARTVGEKSKARKR